VIAGNGAEGLAMLRSQGADLVVSDLAMPQLDGMGLLKALKADARLARIPVVLISASTERARLEQAMELGAADYILKPFSPADLRSRLEALLRR
jgi:CheY-like chemotaxis protein